MSGALPAFRCVEPGRRVALDLDQFLDVGLERVAQAGTIYFDKTGTLTEGRMRVTAWHGDQPTLAAVAGIETSINHPIARAVCSLAEQNELAAAPASDVRQTVGRGVEGRVGGTHYLIGNLRLLDDPGISVGDEWQPRIESFRRCGISPIVVVRQGEVAALFGLRDPVRRDAGALIKHYQRLGWRAGILSGDDQRIVDQVADELGVERGLAHGELLPSDKLNAIERATADGTVLMVGDGVNDAAALAAADVGIAISGGAAASLRAAPVMIGDGNIASVALLADAADRTRRGIRQNFLISIGYNVGAVALAMSGMITPLIAALLMPVSSLTVLGLTLSRSTLGPSDR